METRIAVVGDHDPANESHRATDASLQHAARSLGQPIATEWVLTEALEDDPWLLAQFDAVFLGPGAPYRSETGALEAVRFAREQGWPFFST